MAKPAEDGFNLTWITVRYFLITKYELLAVSAFVYCIVCCPVYNIVLFPFVFYSLALFLCTIYSSILSTLSCAVLCCTMISEERLKSAFTVQMVKMTINLFDYFMSR